MDIRQLLSFAIFSLTCYVFCNAGNQCPDQNLVIRLGPSDAKYVIGWPISIKQEKCQTLNVKAVEQLLVAEWALSFWNGRPEVEDDTLSILVYDTCSEEYGYVRGVLSFLKDTGLYSRFSTQCLNSNYSQDAIPLGITTSIKVAEPNKLFTILQSSDIPILTYDQITSLLFNKTDDIVSISTTPSINHYIKLAVDMIKTSGNNLISVIYDSSIVSDHTIQYLLEYLSDSKIKVYRRMPYQPHLVSDQAAKLISNDSTIMLCILKNHDLEKVVHFFDKSTPKIKMLFVSVPVDDGNIPDDEARIALPQNSTNQLVILHGTKSTLLIKEFKKFLINYVDQNYAVDPLIKEYVEKRLACSFKSRSTTHDKSCDHLLSQNLTKDLWTNDVNIEPILYVVYAFGKVAKKMFSEYPECQHIDIACLKNLARRIGNVVHNFDSHDPKALENRSTLKFDPITRSIKDVTLRASYVWRNKVGKLKIKSIAEFNTWQEDPIFYDKHLQFDAGADDQVPIKSKCHFTLAECVTCENVQYLASSDGVHLQNSADLYIMALFDLGSWDKTKRQCVQNLAADPRALVAPLVFAFTLESFRKKYAELNLLNKVHVGSMVVDTCSSGRQTVQFVTALLNSDCLIVENVARTSNITIPTYNLAAVTTGQQDQMHQLTRQLFGAERKFRQPESRSPDLLLVGPTSDPMPAWSPFNELNSAPEYNIQAKLLVQLLSRNIWDYTTAVVSDYDVISSRSYAVFKNSAETASMCIGEEITLKQPADFADPIWQLRKPTTKVVLFFTTAHDTAAVLQKLKQQYGTHKFAFVFINEARDFRQSISVEVRNQSIFDDREQAELDDWIAGALSLQPAMTLDKDFVDFLTMVTPSLLPERWFSDMWEAVFQCHWPTMTTRSSYFSNKCPITQRLTDLLEFSDIKNRQLTKEAYLAHGVESLLFALDAVYKRLCPAQTGLCEEFFELYRGALNNLAKATPKSDKFTIFNFRPDVVERRWKFLEVGSWTAKEGFVFLEPLMFYELGSMVGNRTLPVSSCKLPACRCYLPHDFFSKPIIEDNNAAEAVEVTAVEDAQEAGSWASSPFNHLDDLFHGLPLMDGLWRGHVWTYFLLVAASLLLFATLAVLSLVVVKLIYGVIRGNQSLGVCLLTGVATLFITCYFFVLDPCPTVCRLRYFGHSVSYCLCFGVMIAKACQLRNSETLGPNGFVSFWNYWLLLFFIVAVQLALNLQWVLARNPVVKMLYRNPGSGDVSGFSYRCSWNGEEFLVSQVYVIILLGLASFLAFVSRNVKRNYKETRWLLYTCLLCVPIWILWSVLYLAMPFEYQDRVIATELLVCGVVILVLMFGPKVYILLSYEPILVDYPASAVLRKYRGARSFDASCTLNKNSSAAPTTKIGGTGNIITGFQTAMTDPYFEIDGAAQLTNGAKSKSIFKRTSGSSSPSDSSSINSASSDTAIYQTAMRKKKLNSNKKAKKSDVKVVVEVQNEETAVGNSL